MAPKQQKTLGISSKDFGLKLVAHDGKNTKILDASRKGNFERLEAWLALRGFATDGTVLPSPTAPASRDAVASDGTAFAPPASACAPSCVVAASADHAILAENAEADSPAGPPESEVAALEYVGAAAEPWGEDPEPPSGAAVQLESAEQLPCHDGHRSLERDFEAPLELIGVGGVAHQPLHPQDASDAVAVDANQLDEASETPVVVNGDDEVSLAIVRRANIIRKLGEYWGFAEWLAWGFASMTIVYMYFGSSVVDLFELFCMPGQG